jgi:hypothetical protein
MNAGNKTISDLGVCKHLRTKKMFTVATMEEALQPNTPADELTCHFWCNKTQTVVGADDRPAHREICNASRRCFEE